MNDRGLILITGGCRSGKSEFAEKIAEKATGTKTYLATSIVTDQEFAIRVRKHQERRPDSWLTVEEPLNVEKVIEKNFKEDDCVLIDSLSGWLTNLMYKDGFDNFEWNEEKEREILKKVERFSIAAKNTQATIIIVADEVGLCLVPSFKEGRVFRDLNGKANQIMASRADKVYFVVSGIPMALK